MESIAPFYVGQEVVAVRDHSEGDYKKGDEFKVTGVRSGCKCTPWIISIGIKNNKPLNGCSSCVFFFFSADEAFFGAKNFAPKIESYQAITYSKVMEQETVSVN